MEFQKGVMTGVGVAMILVQSWLAIEMNDIASMYRDFGNVALPLTTRVTITHAWLYGTPFAGSALIALLVIQRPAKLWPYVAVAGVLLAVVAATYWFPRAPLFMLAGNIK